jgi:hypothetical protein
MSSDLSAEITAIATTVLAAFAFITAILAGVASGIRCKSTGEVPAP